MFEDVSPFMWLKSFIFGGLEWQFWCPGANRIFRRRGMDPSQ
jgi:hypothetical protein